MRYMSSAHRDGIRRAIAAREHGRNKVRSATTAVTVASVVTAGALAFALPGSTHKTSTSASNGVQFGLDGLVVGQFRLRFLRIQLVRHQLRLHGIQLVRHQLRLHRIQLVRLQFHELRLVVFQLELERPQLGLHADLELGQQPGHLRRLMMPHPAGDTAADCAGPAPSGSADASASWRALGTLVQLVVTDLRCLAEARRLLTADLAEVDAACSRFRADSEICALRTAKGRPARISPLLAEAIEVALRAARLTEGDVDPTVGAAMSAIGYDRDFE